MITRLNKRYGDCLVEVLAGELKKQQLSLNIEIDSDGAALALEIVQSTVLNWEASHLFVVENPNGHPIISVISKMDFANVFTMESIESVMSVVDLTSGKSITLDANDEGAVGIICWGGSEPLIDVIKQEISDAVIFLGN